jgi:GH15 family glucan-1,4-alpha-glucosidase
MSLPIEQYALIGDCETAALVGLDGSIDWLCWPSFSSPPCLASLIGTRDNGYWRIAPRGQAKVTRRYRPHTLILETTFETEDGAFMVIDFMPIRERRADVVRLVQGLRGSVAVRMELQVRFELGRSVPWVTREDHTLRAVAGHDMAVLRTPAAHHGEGMCTVCDLTVRENDRIPFVLTYGVSYEEPPGAIDPERALADTQKFWEQWTKRGRRGGRYEEALERSLITLKALTYKPSGGMVAAVTTSLPERIGGQCNWDYRYCWLRDATFTLLALMNAGYHDDARAWRDWLRRSVAGSANQVQIMYGITGQRDLREREVPWLDGYERSKPVRVGNAASTQLQLDVYGEVLDAYFHGLIGLDGHDERTFVVPRLLVEHLENIWQLPDSGIWESRGEPQQFTYSKMMAWVAFDRAIRAARHGGFAMPIERWTQLRDRVHAEVCENAFSRQLGSFVRAYGSKELDGALLLTAKIGFLPETDDRVRGTFAAVEKRLLRSGFVLRSESEKVDDELPVGEGVFLPCSFWMASAWKSVGRDDDARRLFERLLSLRNDVGLLSEEYDPRAKRFLGNFPQALSHIALVHAAFDIEGGDDELQPRAPHHIRSQRGGMEKDS